MTVDADTLALIVALAEPGARAATGAALARRLDGQALYVFVPHPDDPARLVPAPGFAPGVPSSRGWRELLARCRDPGVHQLDVAYPTADATAPAVAYGFPGVAFVVAGAAAPSRDGAAALGALAPLVAGLLGAEAERAAARGDLAVAHDAAQRAEALARALDVARTEAERATRAKDEFLAMLGHELRNPLAPIVTALQIMRLDGAASRAMDAIERQVTHLMRLVDDLLDVGRITSGKIELRRERIEAVTAVARAVEISAPLVEERGHALSIEVPADGLAVDADPARLAQIISNLLTNAAKYSERGSRIRVTGVRDGARIRLAVEDEGIGIEPAFLDRVFDQFVQTPQGLDRARGGLGVGLAIVRSLVELHGGTVRAHSEGVGRGSRFVVELPACDGRVPAPSSRPGLVSSRPCAISPRRVLIVDDNTDAAELLGEALAAQGYQAEVAHTAADALRQIDGFAPDIGILDIGLPGIDGYELARRVRARRPQVRLVALTGYGQSSDRERAYAAGFDAHLVKPVTIASVCETLERLFR